MTRIAVFLLFVLMGKTMMADSTKVVGKKNTRIALYPFAFISKETSLSAGFASLYFLPSKSDSTHFSNIQITAQHSLKQQTNLEFWYQLFFKHDRYRVYGFADYNRFPALFFGTGEMPCMAEMYTSKFQRVRISALKRLNRNWLGGVRYWYENFELQEYEPAGLLSGLSRHHRLSAPGLVLQRDTRSNQFFPSKGMFFEISAIQPNRSLGGSTNFHLFSFDLRKYNTLHSHLILATQLFLQLESGNPSYNQLSMAGGPRILRGYYQGKFRDKNLIALQQELRFILSEKFKWVVFGSIGNVNSRILAPTVLLMSGGTGIRLALDKEKQMHLRGDFAISKHNESGVYLMLEEAF